LVWEEIGSVSSLIEGPWALCGDFNVARVTSEKNCNGRTKGMKEFSDHIEDKKLIDLQSKDATYMGDTWFKGDQQEAASRIYRIQISEEWNANFNNI